MVERSGGAQKLPNAPAFPPFQRGVRGGSPRATGCRICGGVNPASPVAGRRRVPNPTARFMNRCSELRLAPAANEVVGRSLPTPPNPPFARGGEGSDCDSLFFWLVGIGTRARWLETLHERAQRLRLRLRLTLLLARRHRHPRPMTRDLERARLTARREDDPLGDYHAGFPGKPQRRSERPWACCEWSIQNGRQDSQGSRGLWVVLGEVHDCQ
jgi:hypothetical protein